jgi:undecaprenyl diphosphate synthase
MKRSLADEATRTIISFLSLSPLKSQVDFDPNSEKFSGSEYPVSLNNNSEEIHSSIRTTLQRDYLKGYGNAEPLKNDDASSLMLFNRIARSSISRAEYHRLVSLYPAQQTRALTSDDNNLHPFWNFNVTENAGYNNVKEKDNVIEDDPSEHEHDSSNLREKFAGNDGNIMPSNRATSLRRVSGMVHASIVVLGGFAFHMLEYTDEIEVIESPQKMITKSSIISSYQNSNYHDTRGVNIEEREEEEEEEEDVTRVEDLYLAGPDPLRSPRVSLSSSSTCFNSSGRRSPFAPHQLKNDLVITLEAETCPQKNEKRNNFDSRYLGVCLLQRANLSSKSSPEIVSWSSTPTENEQDNDNDYTQHGNHPTTLSTAELSLFIKRQVLPHSTHVFRVTCHRNYLLSTVNDGHTLCISIPFEPQPYSSLSQSDPSTTNKTRRGDNNLKNNKNAFRDGLINNSSSSSSSIFVKKTRVTARGFFLDDSLLGIAGVVCPTHDFSMRIIRPKTNDQSSLDRNNRLKTNNKVVEVIVGQLSSPSQSISSDEKGHSSPPVILLIEPCNVATVWSGLLSKSTFPSGLQSLWLWVNDTLQLQAQDKEASLNLISESSPPVPEKSDSKFRMSSPTSTSTSTVSLGGNTDCKVPTLMTTQQPLNSSILDLNSLTLTREALPKHIAVVMDGNGRWAKCRGLARSDGHRAGVNAIHSLIRSCRRLRIPFLTLYAFSSQNWARPMQEVETLMKLLAEFVEKDLEELCANGVRLLVNGDIAKLPGRTRTGLERMVEASRGNSAAGLTLCLALSYGGREEIIGGVAAACRAHKAGLLDASSLTPESFRAAFLPNPEVPDPCLLIRTSGELRVSNFLLWQIAYTELYVTPALWPDFDETELIKALVTFSRRERRFGKTSEQIASEAAESSSSSSSSSTNTLTSASSSGANRNGDMQSSLSLSLSENSSSSVGSNGKVNSAEGNLQTQSRRELMNTSSLTGRQAWRQGAFILSVTSGLALAFICVLYYLYYVAPLSSTPNATPSSSPALKSQLTPWPIPGPTVQRREREL